MHKEQRTDAVASDLFQSRKQPVSTMGTLISEHIIEKYCQQINRSIT